MYFGVCVRVRERKKESERGIPLLHAERHPRFSCIGQQVCFSKLKCIHFVEQSSWKLQRLITH
jgi:hypothetical protein